MQNMNNSRSAANGEEAGYCACTVTSPFGFGPGQAQPTDLGRVRPISKKKLKEQIFF
jgi:hypothetical protein